MDAATGDYRRQVGSVYRRQVGSVLGAEMRASAELMDLSRRSPAAVHTALTRVPAVWRRLDAYVAGRTTVAGPCLTRWPAPPSAS